MDAKAAIKIDLFNDDFLMEPAKVSYCLMSLLIVFIAIVRSAAICNKMCSLFNCDH